MRASLRLTGAEIHVGSESEPDNNRAISLRLYISAFTAVREVKSVCCVADLYSTAYNLTAKPETILERVKENHDRPLLENNKTVEYVSELMEKRRPAYEAAADIVIATDGKSANEICEEIIAQVKKFK